jgi:hypothetical protein
MTFALNYSDNLGNIQPLDKRKVSKLHVICKDFALAG